MVKRNQPHDSRALARKHLTWETARAYAFILVGALIQAIAMRLFLIPSKLVSGGISGIITTGQSLYRLAGRLDGPDG